MSSAYDFTYQTKSDATLSSISNEAVLLNPPVRLLTEPLGVGSSGTKNIWNKNHSQGPPSAKKAFFGTPTVTPQKHAIETDGIMRRECVLHNRSNIFSFFSGVESDPVTVQLKLPEGSSLLSLVASLCYLFAAGHCVHEKPYYLLLSPLYFSSFISGFLCGVLNRALSTALSDKDRNSGTAYALFLTQSASAVILAASIKGEMLGMAIFFLLGRNILIKYYCTADAGHSFVSTTAETSNEVKEMNNKLLYNSGIGKLAPKQRFT